MNNGSYRGHQLLYIVAGIFLVLFVVLGFALYNVVNNAAQGNVSGQTSVGANTAAQAIYDKLSNGHYLGLTVAGQPHFEDVVSGTAGPLQLRSVAQYDCNIVRANQQVVAFYIFNAAGKYMSGQDRSSCTHNGSVSAAHVPAGWFIPHGALNQDLLAGAKGVANYALAFDPSDKNFFSYNLGSLYHIHAVSNGVSSGAGSLVERFDAHSTFSSYMQPGNIGNLILSGNVVVVPDMANYLQRGQLPVTTVDASLDRSITGGLTQTPVGFTLTGNTPHFTLNGVAEVGSLASVQMSTLQEVSYAPASSISDSSRGIIIAVIAFFMALLLAGVGLFIVLNRRIQRGQQESAMLVRAKSEALTEDIVAVSQALAVAREGDLTVQVPDSESEVGLLSLSLNGLISDYGQIVGGIVRASQAVQEGAARVDEGVRRIVDVATSQAESVAVVASSVEEVATSAVDVQQATETATTLAANARDAVHSGQASVGRIAEAVDAIKEAAIGTTREFKRLQEDSIRLTALVASVKSNAENLDMQAANATLEARHLGTESGSAFATNIGRLARQAQDTLADAEGAVRSVVTSIDEVNRRIERISEQVRRGVEEVRTVRTTFEEITQTNGSLVQFIDNVAESAGVQAESAQQAAHSISEIALVFEQFTELLITSGDEIANMRLIVAGLRESVADLRVEDTSLLGEVGMDAVSAA